MCSSDLSNGEAGVKAPVPQVILELEISEATAVLGDVDGDGAVTAGDVSVLRNAVSVPWTAWRRTEMSG